MALFPPGYLNAVVSLGVMNGSSFQHIGTGFLYSHPTKEGEQSFQTTFVITNRHVAEKQVTHIRFNRPSDNALVITDIEEIVQSQWHFHQSGLDIAVRPVAAGSNELMDQREIGLESFIGSFGVPSEEDRRKLSEGDGVFVLGFPLGLTGQERNYPIVRQGNIARIQDWIQGSSQTILIDAPGFPGSSGGPVILKPEHVAIKDTQSITTAFLLGVNTSYIPSRDVAVSTQTGQIRVIFEENSGLSEVVPIFSLKDILDSFTYNLPE